MKEPLNKGTDEEPIFRVKWSEFDLYVPFRFRIIDWKGLKIAHYGKGEFMLVISEMDYNKQKIELCVPYGNFVRRLQELPMENQRWIVQGKAVITIMKSYIHDCWGMKIIKVEYNQS